MGVLVGSAVHRRLRALAQHVSSSSGGDSAAAAGAASAASGAAAGAGKGLKVYISVDIEGVVGIAHWDEAAKLHSDYPQFAQRMTAEAVAACEGALAAGATDIIVRDAHGAHFLHFCPQIPLVFLSFLWVKMI